MPTGLFDDIITVEPQGSGFFDDIVEGNEGGEQLPASELAAIDSEAANFPKKPAMGVGEAFFRGVQQPFKSFGMAPGIPLLSDEKLGEHLEEEYRNLNRREAPGVPAQVSETIGGLAGTVGQLMAHQYLTRGRVPARATAAATFGTSGAYNAFLKAGMNALSEGKSTEEALDIAKKASLVGAGVGAATGAVLPPGAANFRQALKQGAMLGGLGAAGAATENVAERALGLQTPLMSGVVPAGGTMGVIPPVMYGLSLAFRSRARPATTRPQPARVEPARIEAPPEPQPIKLPATIEQPARPITPEIATEAPKLFKQSPMPERFETVDQILEFRKTRLNEEAKLYEQEIGLTKEEAETLASLMARDASTERFEKRIGPEKAARLTKFFDESPYNKVGGPFEFWEKDSRLNPEEIAFETDKTLLSSTLVTAVQRGVEAKPNSDRFISAVIAATRLRESGGTLSDVARYIDDWTTRESTSQADKAEFFNSLAGKVRTFLDSQGIKLEEGDLSKNAPRMPPAALPAPKEPVVETPAPQLETVAPVAAKSELFQSAPSELPKGELSAPIRAEPPAIETTTTLKEGIQPEITASPEGKRGLIVEPYSTPMLERLDSLGGPESRRVAAQARQIDADAVTMAGAVGPVVDKARQLASRAFRGGTTWIRGKDDVTPTAAISRLNSLEGLDKAEVVQRAPEQAREMVGAIWDANTTAVGGLAAEAKVGFAPRGMIQRILTGRGMDTTREGGKVSPDGRLISGSKLWYNWIVGNAKANNLSISKTADFFNELKAMLDEPHPDAAKVDNIAQDYHRKLPKAITHAKSTPGGQWIEMLVSDPVDYLKAATERTARAAAFRKVYPNTPEGRQLLVDTHKAVLAELPTATRKEEFNNLIKVLQGHRLDTDLTTTVAGIPGAQGAMEGVSTVTRPLKASMLSLSSLANAAETVIGGPAIFLKYKNIIPLLTRNPIRFYKQLEMAGLVDKATRNFAFNPIKPAQSVSRMVSEGIGRLTMNNFWNEVQEYTGSGSSRILADRVRANDLTPGERADFESVLRAMGFRDKFEDIAAGRDLEGLAQFERMAAPFLSGGRQRPATSSRWGNSRAFNALFWFHRYPQMVLNQARGILNNLIEDAQTKNPRHAYRDLKLASKFLGFKAAQGVLMTLIVTAVKEGGEGVAQMIREAREAFGGFLWQVTANAIGGPVTIANRIGQRASTGEDVAMEAIKASAPVSSGIDLFNALAGKGRYNGLGTFETAAQFIQSKTPAIPAVRSAMGVVGLADDNPKLRAATTGFYRWARKQGYEWPEGRPKDAKFTATMRQTVREMERGGEWQETLRKAIAVKAEAGQDARRSVQQSLQQRKILRNQFGGALSADEIESLRSWLGEDNFQVLQQRDAMIDAVADAFSK